jgi:hypothetical protein
MPQLTSIHTRPKQKGRLKFRRPFSKHTIKAPHDISVEIYPPKYRKPPTKTAPSTYPRQHPSQRAHGNNQRQIDLSLFAMAHHIPQAQAKQQAKPKTSYSIPFFYKTKSNISHQMPNRQA